MLSNRIKESKENPGKKLIKIEEKIERKKDKNPPKKQRILSKSKERRKERVSERILTKKEKQSTILSNKLKENEEKGVKKEK